MLGPKILTRTMSVANKGKDGVAWQYHSQSDRHSKVACWTVLFDLLQKCEPFQRDARRGVVGFRVNCVMVGPINKTLDLVVTQLSEPRAPGNRRSFMQVGEAYGVVLDDAERGLLASLPIIYEDSSLDISETAIALEAKACMTAHVKSLPRLHAEIVATGYLAKRAKPNCITASYSLVNAARTFRSPGSKHEINVHTQPGDARRVIDMIATAIPRTSDAPTFGYDVIGVTSIVCANDGSAVSLGSDDAAPSPRDAVHYQHMLNDLCSAYRRRFGGG
jgi:hypothetical protein